jgi:hypothetical protein
VPPIQNSDSPPAPNAERLLGTEFILHGRSGASGNGDIPTWSCLVDEVPIKPEVVSTTGRFTCPWKGSAGNIHNFRLSIDSPGSVAVESVWFLPTYNSTRVDNSFVVFNHDDPNVSKHTGNWRTYSHGGENATLTNTTGSSLSLLFTG